MMYRIDCLLGMVKIKVLNPSTDTLETLDHRALNDIIVPVYVLYTLCLYVVCRAVND